MYEADEAAAALAEAGMCGADVIATLRHLQLADEMGAHGQGMVRVPWIAAMDFSNQPEIAERVWSTKDTLTKATWRVSASHRIGYAMMEAAVALPLEDAVANLVVVERCFPSGALRVWARDLCDRGFASIMTCTSPARAPHPDGDAPVLGTIPLCVAVPDPYGNHVIADTSLTEHSYGDVLLGTVEADAIQFHSLGMWALAVAFQTMVRSMTTEENSVLFVAFRPTFKAAVEETAKQIAPWRMPGQTEGGGL
jgi:LDH2 family malate/lactate/ureidoglycolate dehydrogenase